jgi:hypothetical protein
MIGRLLRGVRAGDRDLVCNSQALRDAPATIGLHSASFAEGGLMPPRCAGPGVGENVSPQLGWSDVPEGATELVLIMQDPDAPLLKVDVGTALLFVQRILSTEDDEPVEYLELRASPDIYVLTRSWDSATESVELAGSIGPYTNGV